MISTENLAGELSDAGKLLGLLNDTGGLNDDWFGDPLGQLEGALTRQGGRDALVNLLNALLPPASLAGTPPGQSWYPLLGDKPQGNLYLTVDELGDGILLGAGGAFGGPMATLRAQLPLIKAGASIQGQLGPLEIQLRAQVGITTPIRLDAVSAVASIAPDAINLSITLEKLSLTGEPPEDVLLDPQHLGAEGVHLIAGLVQQALHTAGAAAGTEAGAVAADFLPLLGIGDTAIPLFPLTDPSQVGSWLDALLHAAPMQAWLTHLGNLMGSGTLAVSGSGTAADPWTVGLVPLKGASLLSLTAVRAGNNLQLGLQGTLAATAGNMVLQAQLASIPIGGTGTASVLPSASFLFVKGPGLVSNANITVGTIQGGLNWSSGALHPVLELLDVTLEGTHYAKLDLTNTNSVAQALSAAVRNALLAGLGNSGPGRSLAALATLVTPSGDPASPHLVDPIALVANPARAIAQQHRAALLDPTHSWGFLLSEVGALMGLSGAVTGAGTQANPWMLPLEAANPIGVQLVAWNAQAPGNPAAVQQLRLGLQASVTSAPATFSWTAELLAFDLPQSGEGSVSLMGGQHASLRVQPGMSLNTGGFSLSAGSFEADLNWAPGSSMQWTAEVQQFSIGWNGTTLQVPLLQFPAPGGFDVSSPTATAASFGLQVVDLEKLLRLLAAKVALSWGQMPGYLLTALTGIQGPLPGMQADWPVLQGFLANPFPAMRTWLGSVATGLSADQTPFLIPALNYLQAFLSATLPDAPDTPMVPAPPDGLGTYEDPWVLPLASDSTGADALVWLEPAGPPLNWGAGIAQRAASIPDFEGLIELAQELAALNPQVADAFRDIDPVAMADALSQISDFLADSDGVVSVESQIPSGGTWTSGAVNAAHPLQPQDPAAITQISQQIDAWAGGPAGARAVLLVGPAFTDHTAWSGLIGAKSTANFNLRVPGVDPSAVNLDAVTTVADYYTADLSSTGDVGAQIQRLVARIGALRPGVKVTLVAHSTAGVAARAFTAANPVLIKGLITLGSPHLGADLPFLNDPAFASGVRLMSGLRAGLAAGPLRDALDHMIVALDGYLPPPNAGALPVAAPYPASAFIGAGSTDTAGVNALALGGTIQADLLATLQAAVGTLATQAAGGSRPAPTHIAFGVRGQLDFGSPKPGAVNVQASVRANAFRIKLQPAAAEPARPAKGFAVRLYLNRPGDWLLNQSDVRVRTAELGVDATGTPAPYLLLRQAAFHAPTVSRMTLGDAAGQAVLGAIMHAISVPAPLAQTPVAGLLQALKLLGVTAPDPASPDGVAFSGDAYSAILTNVSAFFQSRIPPALAAGVAGLNGPLALGSLPLELDVTPSQVAIRTSPGIDITDFASLSFDTLAPSATLNIGMLSFTWASGTLSMSAAPWLAPMNLPPDAATLKSALNDALPRLLFSSAAGAALEALMGPGFLAGPLDQFFTNTAGTISNALSGGSGGGGGRAGGSGIDGNKVNDLLQLVNNLAGFAAGPGLSLPGGLQLTASGSDPAVISVGTTTPIGGVADVTLSVSIDTKLHPTPGGALAVTIPLPAGGPWPSVQVKFADDGTGVSLSFAPQGIAPIQILPTFSGLGGLMGQVDALLPEALDKLVTALAPAPTWLTDVLNVLTQLTLYDNAGGFKAHTQQLQGLLQGNWTSLFNPTVQANAMTAAAAFLNNLGGISPPVTVAGTALQWKYPVPNAGGGTVGFTLGWDAGGATASLEVENLKFASGGIQLTASAGFANGALLCHLNCGVPLKSALGIDLTPSLDVSVANNAFTVVLNPLAQSNNAGPLTVTLAPKPGAQLQNGAADTLINNLLVPLVANVAVTAFKPHYGDVVLTDSDSKTKTVLDLLQAAHLLDGSQKLTTPMPDLLTMATGLLTGLGKISIPVGQNLNLSLVTDGTLVGIGLSGREDFVAGNYTVSAMFGAPSTWEAGANGGIEMMFLDTANNTITFHPKLILAGLGVGLSGVGDAPLVDLSGFRLGGFRGYFFWDRDFKSGAASDPFGGGIELDGLGLPLGLATGGGVGGNNPVASNLLTSGGDSGGGDPHPVNPALDVSFWSWKTGFHIQFGGASDLELWISVHRGFGPIYIDQVGLEVSADSKSIGLLIDGSVKVSSLTAQVYELTISVPFQYLTKPEHWSLDLQGLAVGFQSAEVTIAGGLKKSGKAPVEYDGMLLIQISEFGFIAIGAYSTPPVSPGSKDTYTSLFIFAGVFVVIGIPPIVEITGLGLGVGYNRELEVPTDLNAIPGFILVEVLDQPDKIADDPMGALMSMGTQIPAKRGSFWLAAGLRGTSFVVVHVTVILYVALDRGVEIGILGVARMALPTADTALVSLELALKIRFSSSESLFSIQAQLTSNSYLLNKDCQLTGGFAYFMWFAKSQFLLTIGGYHPAFHRLPEYPDVPRLGFHWSFLGIVYIKGEAYFALTNTAVMAGARLEATAGPDWLYVWLTAYTDFLLSWEPFYYDFDIGISVGVHLHLDLGLFTIDITLSLGASLELAGPPLHGTVTLDLDVCSVTVGFGPDPQPQQQPIPWAEFVDKHLHSGKPGNEPAVAHVLTGLLPPDPSGGQPSPGTQAQPWKLSAEWSFQTETRMPAMDFTLQTTTARNEGDWSNQVFGAYTNLSTVYQFDIAPMLVDHSKDKLTSTHKITLESWNASTKQWQTMAAKDPGQLAADAADRDTNGLYPELFQVSPVIAQVSEATYHLMPHDDIPAAARTLPVIGGIKIGGTALLQVASSTIPIGKLVDPGPSRPLPFATLDPIRVGGLKTLGQAAEAMAQVPAGAPVQTLYNAASSMLSGGGFFADARAQAGLPAAGLHPLAARSLRKFRSAPPLISPLTMGLTMNPVGLSAPPQITKLPPTLPVVLSKPRLRAVLQGRPAPSQDVPPPPATTARMAPAGTLRTAPPRVEQTTGASLRFVRAATAPSPTRMARGGRTLKSAQFGWSAGQAHTTQFAAAEQTISTTGVSVPAGATHIWDVPASPALAVSISSPNGAVARLTFLSRAGGVLDDREAVLSQTPLPAGCAMVAVTCLGKASGGLAGWQTGNLARQVGSSAMLCRRSVLVLSQAAPTQQRQMPTAQAIVPLSQVMVNQPGVETWLPQGVTVIGVLLDVVDPTASEAGDLALAVTGARLITPPVRLAGGRRKMLLYNVAPAERALHVTVAVASMQGLRLAGVVGMQGTAQEWGVRFNGEAPPHLIPDTESTPDGDVVVHLAPPAAPPPPPAGPGTPNNPLTPGGGKTVPNPPSPVVAR